MSGSGKGSCLVGLFLLSLSSLLWSACSLQCCQEHESCLLVLETKQTFVLTISIMKGFRLIRNEPIEWPAHRMDGIKSQSEMPRRSATDSLLVLVFVLVVKFRKRVNGGQPRGTVV